MDNGLLEEYSEFERTFRRYQDFKNKKQGPLGNPHRGQGRILALLQLQPEITQKELTFLLDMRPQSLGELLAKLEAKGYLTRRPSTKDRRVMVIQLTEEGKAAAEVATSSETGNVFQQLSQIEKSQLSNILGKLTETMNKELPEEELKITYEVDAATRRKLMKEFRRGGFGGHDSLEGFFQDGGHRRH